MYLKNVLKFFLVGATFLSAVSPDFLMAMAPLPEDEVVDFSPQTAISHKDPSIGGDQELMRATEAFRSLLPGASLPSDDLLRPAIQSILEPYKRKLKQAHREIEDLNKRLFSPEKGAVSAKVSNQALRAQRRGSEPMAVRSSEPMATNGRSEKERVDYLKSIGFASQDFS